MRKRSQILIVDDSELNRSMLADILYKEYDVLEAENGREAIAMLQEHEHEISLMLLDIVMPEMDGFEVLAVMGKNKWLESIPVIIISAESASTYIDSAYDLGATEYISRPFDPKAVQRRVGNTVLLYSKQKMLENMVTNQMLDKEKSNLIMVEVLSHIVEFRNGESGMHVLNIRSITKMLLAQLCRISDQYSAIQPRIPLIANASALHDIGKISISESILNKPGKLTPEEWLIMKTHSEAGANILESTRYYPHEELVSVARDICRWHHERYDGKGYPDGLVGDDIPIEAQVVALADVYDTLTHKRVYKEALPHEVSMRMIFDGECGAFNPLLLQCLADIGPQLEKELKLKSLGHASKDEMIDVTRSMMQSGNVSNRTLALLEQERIKYQFFADLSREIQFEYTAHTDTLMLSEWGASQLGLPSFIENPNGNPELLRVMVRRDMESLRNLILSASPKDPKVSGHYLLNVNGTRRWHKFLARPLWLGNDADIFTGFIGKCIDVHDERLKMDRLIEQANTDALTGLYHRKAARKVVQEALDEAESGMCFTLMLFDLDFFKHANDHYGHLFGDELLQETARRMLGAVRDVDITARIGGDEFLIFIESPLDSTPAVERIFSSLRCTCKGHPITVSMGVARAPQDGMQFDELFHCADRALYAAKQRGRNCYCLYDDSMAGQLSVLSEIPSEEAGEQSPDQACGQ